MTNAEKFKTAKEREEAFRNFCGERDCSICPLRQSEDMSCRFAWLYLEAEEEQMTATEVVNILAEYNQWRRCEGEYGKAGSLCPHPPQRLSKAINRAIELLRNIKE